MGTLQLIPAQPHHSSLIWEMLQQAIERRKNEGSLQWQDGYPNLATVHHDIFKGYGHLLCAQNIPLVYGALIWNDEPAYEKIKGNWLSNEKFLVVHRVAVANQALGKGFVVRFFEELENFVKANHVYSIKVDTNFDNGAMLHILDKLGYTYCGEVILRGGARRAYEKWLK